MLSGRGAKTLGLLLWDRLHCLMTHGVTLSFGSVSTISASWVSGASVTWLVPKYARSGMKIRVYANLRRTAGTGTVSYRARETGVPTNGTEQTSTSSSDNWVSSDITIPSNTWAGSKKTFDLQGKTSDGTSTVSVDVVKGAMFVKVVE